MTKIKVKVDKTVNGYSAHAEKYAAFTTGDTVAELTSNMVEALNLYFEAEGKGKVIDHGDLSFELQLTSVFEVFPVINMKALANRLDMNNTLLSQYASGKKKPSARQTEKILQGINEVGRELAELNLIS